MDSEYVAVMNFLRYQQQRMQASFDYWFDQSDIATKRVVYLESPAQGEELKPTPYKALVRAWEIPVRIRSTAATPIYIAV
jgi:hypothetical protein